ncbi:hypothetical protein BH10PSE18_BH10PSE18_08260 [soil metagenome]
MSKKRINILTTVNSANVSKDGDTYTIRDVVHAIDGIVLNRRLYTGKELAKSVGTLESRPAPAGHPKDRKGRHISASNGEALGASWIGAWCVNSRYEGGKALCDIKVNGAQAQALPAGKEVVARLDAAIAGTNTDPIGVSSGLNLDEVEATGESLGKAYTTVATNLQFDHLAILLSETPAGTPEEGIGMFVNSAGEEEAVETVSVNTDPVDRRSDGVMKKLLRKLLGNGSDMSFDQISEAIRAQLPKDAWPREIFEKYFIWGEYPSDTLWKQEYSIDSSGSLAFIGQAEEVRREVTYEPITNQRTDPVKDNILAALNAAGITTAGLDDTKLLAAYNSLVQKPGDDKLIAANSRIAELEGEKTKVENAERDALATKLATNSSLTADDFKAMPLARLKELDAKAAPVVVGNANKTAGDEFFGYDINKL